MGIPSIWKKKRENLHPQKLLGMGKHKQKVAQQKQGASFIGLLAVIAGIALLWNFPTSQPAVIVGAVLAFLGGIVIKATA